MKGEVQFRAERLAVLIDADNADPNLVEPLLTEISRYGTAHVKRIYGNWTTPQLGKWKDKLLDFAIQPIQQFAYTTGKNATDSALIIDAMDLLYSGNLDAFCIVSSDSDYTRLATRIRESGLYVYGFGQRKTPKAFVSACDKFIYTEILKPDAMVVPSHLIASTFQLDAMNTALAENNSELPLDYLKEAYDLLEGEDGWIDLGGYGSKLTQLHPEFDPRNYGFKQLGKLVRASNCFEVREIPHEKNPNAKVFLIKWKA